MVDDTRLGVTMTEIVKGDTMTVHLETTVTTADDTLKHASVDFVMNPGQDLNSDSDDVCYAIHVSTEKKFGLERSSEFHFISDKGIPHGQEPTADGRNEVADIHVREGQQFDRGAVLLKLKSGD